MTILSIIQHKIRNKEITYGDVCVRADIHHTTLWRWFHSRVKPKGKSWNRFIKAARSLGIEE